LLLPTSLVSFQQLCRLCCVLVLSSLFMFSIFCGRVSPLRRLCWHIPGVAGGIPHDTWHSPVWSAECLPSRFGARGWCRWQPSCFLSVVWLTESFYGLGVQRVEVLILLGALFLQSVAPPSQ
jgi:hypothetical protein